MLPLVRDRGRSGSAAVLLVGVLPRGGDLGTRRHERIDEALSDAGVALRLRQRVGYRPRDGGDDTFDQS